MLLVGNGRVITRDPENPYIQNGAVLIEGDSIVAVGPEADLKAQAIGASYVDAKGGVIMPGLVNCHTHIYSGLARGLAIKGCNPTNFLENLEQQWWKIDDNLTLDGTRIDFPVVQGADNMVYVNTDVYGDFSLSGAIFLDSRCPADFTAPYSIVYGHHIEDGGMFGDIVQFTQSDYFAAHTTGTLITDDTAYNIALFACVRADAYDPVLYDPAQSPDALLAYIKAHAVQYRTPGSGPVVAFSTCTEAATNGRVLLFGQLLPQT